MNGGAGMTLDRDIRMSADEMIYVDRLVRKRIRELGKTLARADANRRAGAKIQHGTYEHHLNEIAALGAVRDSLEVARKQIQYRVREKLNLNTDQA